MDSTAPKVREDCQVLVCLDQKDAMVRQVCQVQRVQKETAVWMVYHARRAHQAQRVAKEKLVCQDSVVLRENQAPEAIKVREDCRVLLAKMDKLVCLV